jgi:hypothetical protein
MFAALSGRYLDVFAEDIGAVYSICGLVDVVHNFFSNPKGKEH